MCHFHPELSQTLKRYNFDCGTDTLIRYQHLVPMLQTGPQCGFVTLAMLADNESRPHLLNKLLSKARDWQFTISGELFSAQFVLALARYFFADYSSIQLFSGDLNCSQIKDHLAVEGLALIPYDCDYNHEPCIKNGHGAHWALICGLIAEQVTKTHFVLARHGKTVHLNVWSLEKLARSNGQLNEIRPDRLDSNKYVVPEGGIGGPNGLKNKAILIKK